MPGALYGAGQLTLVPGANPCLAARADFAFVGHITTQNLDQLVVNPGVLIRAEGALARPGKKPPASGLVIISRWLIAHVQDSLLVLLEPDSYI